jgi:hypothetical protein
MSESPSPRYSFINLPHAYTILGRIARCVDVQRNPPPEETAIPALLTELEHLLRDYPEDPKPDIAIPVAVQAAAIARSLVAEIEKVGYRGDRLGQCVRNLFECLDFRQEGAELSLRCGERPDSPMRP